MAYNPEKIEVKWQKKWEEEKVYELPEKLADLQNKPKYYVLDMFPYPSGAGLHVGHPASYTATDIIARLKRSQGFNVMHPFGWDAFGLPAERGAVRENIHPAKITKRNTDNFKRQLKRLGFSYDWSREISTTHPDYYKWTQWIFLKLYEKDLAYLADVPVNWCPALGTVLANEEVKDGKYVETGDLVEQRVMRQWMLKITAYADRLLEDLDELDWPEGVKEMQRNWIGKSVGQDILFNIEGSEEKLEIFTTRADTLLGVPFMVIAPEHPLTRHCEAASNNNEELWGYDTGLKAIHPITKKKLPIWVGSYVLSSYGTGAVMAVPKTDERDQKFAELYNLEILDYKPLEESKWPGKKQTNYKLRDWLFSRQRYWGEPFPIAYDQEGNPRALEESLLPIKLPHIDSYKPTETGEPPLARASSDWLNIKFKDGSVGRREVNTMPQWAGSCWYYLRYLDPRNPDKLIDSEIEKYWMPVDLYIGGVEHAVLHLLYARFWHKVLYDCGVVSTKEPFKKLFNQGMILARSYQDSAGKYYYPEQVEQKDSKYFVKNSDICVKTQVEKMSKSRFNVVNPDDIVKQYGADALRLYEMFMGPLDQVKPWNTNGVEGVYRFLQRAFRLVDKPLDSKNLDQNLVRLYHKTIKRVQEDTLALKFNTAISQMMIFVNEATNSKSLDKNLLLGFAKILSPYAPHIAEEIWEKLGQKGFVCEESWPKFDPNLCLEDKIKIAVQINGKRRAEIETSKNMSKQDIEKLALESSQVQHFLGDNTPKKIIVIPGRIVNIVV